MIILFLGFLLVFLSGVSKGISDRISFHYDTIPSWVNEQYWNPLISYKNKYKDGDKNKGEKFKFSTTFLVFLTDGWHLTQFFHTKLLIFGVFVLSLQLNMNIQLLFCIFAFYHLGFKIIYK